MIDMAALSIIVTVLLLSVSRPARKEPSYRFIVLPLAVIMGACSLYGYYLAPTGYTKQYRIEVTSSIEHKEGENIITLDKSNCIESDFYGREDSLFVISNIIDGNIMRIDSRPVALSMCKTEDEEK